MAEECRGPQSFAHKRMLSRLHFTLDPAAQRAAALLDEDVQSWLQCTTCGSWRRIDLQTHRTYGNALYHRHEKMFRRQRLLEAVPSFLSYLAMCLRQHKERCKDEHPKRHAEEECQGKSTSKKRDVPRCVFTIADLRRCLEGASSARVRELSANTGPGATRAMYELCCDLCSYENIVAAEFTEACDKFNNEDAGHAFSCSSLVACNCDVPCDYETAGRLPNRFDTFAQRDKEPLVVRDVDDQNIEYSAVFHGYNVRENACAVEGAQHCCVVGCTTQFRPSHPKGETYKNNTAFEIAGLCKKT